MNSTTAKRTVVDALNWRYATKKFDPTKKLSLEDLNEILEAVRLSPSSRGLQAWKIVLVENADLRSKLRVASYDQSQVTDASHLLVLAAKSDIDEIFVDRYIERVAVMRGIRVETLQGYKQSIMSSITKSDGQARSEWLVRQVYIALGVILAVCAAKHIDSCPMEGFDKIKVDEVLGLREMGLQSVLMCPLGYRDSRDEFAEKKKVRWNLDEIMIKK